MEREVFAEGVGAGAGVPAALAFWNVTVPGPLPLLQVVVTAPGGLGSPSSVTVPSSVAPAGSVMVWSSPASTTGAVLGGGCTVTCSESVVASDP